MSMEEGSMGMKRGVHGHEGGVHGHEGGGSMGMKGAGPWGLPLHPSWLALRKLWGERTRTRPDESAA